MRLPYGERNDPVEQFAFEELTEVRNHEHYLWGNPAFVCAMALTKSFTRDDHHVRRWETIEIDDLPAHTYREDGEIKLQPCAEVLLGDRAAEAILNQGIMPLLSYPDRNAARLGELRTLAG